MSEGYRPVSLSTVVQEIRFVDGHCPACEKWWRVMRAKPLAASICPRHGTPLVGTHGALGPPSIATDGDVTAEYRP